MYSLDSSLGPYTVVQICQSTQKDHYTHIELSKIVYSLEFGLVLLWTWTLKNYCSNTTRFHAVNACLEKGRVVVADGSNIPTTRGYLVSLHLANLVNPFTCVVSLPSCQTSDKLLVGAVKMNDLALLTSIEAVNLKGILSYDHLNITEVTTCVL